MCLAFLGAYALLNLVVLLMYGMDKGRAKRGRRRIPERDLLLAALIGPFGAMAGMRWFRHKTRKALFKLVPLFALLHLALALLLL
ncbi:MAG TPA: DUF1294 domain-containing protein [Methanomassiliicoccales archaeon]|nr:DUF1294 domain-containing protein [Methanomassiliicoccales archaeon]